MIKFFTADWCTVCKSMYKEVEDFDVETVNVDTHEDQVLEYSIRSVPTLILVDEEGNEQKRLPGGVNKNAIQAWLDE